MQSTNFGGMNRRKYLTGVGAALTAGVAGCADNTTDPEPTDPEPTDPEPTDNITTDDTEDTTEEQKLGLDLDFTWDDVIEAERENYERGANFVPTGAKKSALEAANPSHIQNADLTSYNEFQNALITTLNQVVEYLGNINPDTASSATTGDASDAVNLILQDELINNDAYTNFDAKVINGGVPGHGFCYIASTHHPALTADSNTDNIGRIQDKPLEDRNNSVRDPVAYFVGKTLEEVDESDRSTYRGFPKSVYAGKGKLDVGIDPNVIDDYYQEAVFAEDGELWMGPVRDAVATLSYMMEKNYFEDANAVAINTSPTELPEINKSSGFNVYAEDLLNHLDEYETADSFRENVLEP